MIDCEFMAPETYARRIAAYISDPSTIRIRTLETYGRAPSRERCAELRRLATTPTSCEDRRHKKMREYNPFPCGHDRIERNTLRIGGKEECKTCREAAQAKAKREYQQRLRRAANRQIVLKVEHDTTFTGDLLQAVSQSFCITKDELLSPSRHPHLVCARAVAARILRDRGVSYPEIARRLGRKDHSTSMNLIETFDTRAKRFPEVRRVYEALRG